MGINILFWTAIGFFCGAIPFSVLLARLYAGADISRVGDGNPGAANAWRAGGWRVGALAMALDFLKGAVPVAAARFLGGARDWELVPIALAPVLGHAFSPFLSGRGGKGGERGVDPIEETALPPPGPIVQQLESHQGGTEALQLPLGRIRLRRSGSAGGHNGLKSIIQHLGTEFPRLRLGVGRGDPKWDLADHVLSRFDRDERDAMVDSVKRAADAIELKACLADGRVTTLGRGAGAKDAVALELARGILPIVQHNAQQIHARFPKTNRRNAGYALDTILGQVEAGVDAAAVDLTPLLARPGILTKRPPDPEERLDFEFGYRMADAVAGLVAITAPCAFVSPAAAVLVGGAAGVLVVYAVGSASRAAQIRSCRSSR